MHFISQQTLFGFVCLATIVDLSEGEWHA